MSTSFTSPKPKCCIGKQKTMRTTVAARAMVTRRKKESNKRRGERECSEVTEGGTAGRRNSLRVATAVNSGDRSESTGRDCNGMESDLVCSSRAATAAKRRMSRRKPLGRPAAYLESFSSASVAPSGSRRNLLASAARVSADTLQGPLRRKSRMR